MISSLKLRVQRYEGIYMRQKGLIPLSYQHHKEIIACIAKDDMRGALSSLQENWRFGMEALLKSFHT